MILLLKVINISVRRKFKGLNGLLPGLTGIGRPACWISLKYSLAVFFHFKKNCTFAARLSDGVMAALQILVLPVQVRILVGQQRLNENDLEGTDVPSFIEK